MTVEFLPKAKWRQMPHFVLLHHIVGRKDPSHFNHKTSSETNLSPGCNMIFNDIDKNDNSI